MEPTIFTLNARENILLEVARDYFSLTNPVIHREIQAIHFATQQILASKGIYYTDLRSGLVPSTDRHEAGFVFDSGCIGSSLYGVEVARVILPFLDKRTTQSVLCGDLLGDSKDQIFKILNKSLVPVRSPVFNRDASLYCVYINNLSESVLERLHKELAKFPAYIGFIPATFASQAKIYLSTTLTPNFLKHNSQVIMGHEDDVPNEKNLNMTGYPFEDFGYKVISLQSSYFDLFLTYKIERSVHPGFEIDTEMALNAISDHVLPLTDCTVLLEEAKYGYLQSEKLSKLQKAGIAELDQIDLVELIQSKIAANYIYNLFYSEEYNVIKFNLMLEVPRREGGYPTRLTAALEYMPQQKTLRVITLF